MLDYVVKSRMPGVQIRHVRMELSTDESQVGKFRWKKAFRLFPIMIRIVLARLKYGSQILYYAPAGANRVSMLRDIVILGATRFLFRRTVLHYHSGGHAELYQTLPAWQKWLFRRAFFHADGAIRLSELTPEDGKGLDARREFFVPNGMEDIAGDLPAPQLAAAISAERPLRLLFVALLCEAKGLLVLIKACGELARRGVPVQLDVMGRFESPEFEARTKQLIAELGIEGNVNFLGVLTGQAKLEAFYHTDMLCHPTFYDTFGLVILEAMACSKPVVATRWASIPTIINDGQTGYLVEPHDSITLADRIEELAADPQLRQQMGEAGRERFLSEFNLPRHIEHMRQVFLSVGGDSIANEAAASEQQWAPAPLEPSPVGA
jgi:glycosyltransferase involved in cell wall biosynthesis